MTVYYGSALTGNDSWNGRSPNPGGAGVGPWKTIGKSVNTGSVLLPGDTCYYAGGKYYNEQNISPIASITSSISPTAIRGDPGNVQGFLDAEGNRLPAARCYVTTRLSTESASGVSSTSAVLNLGAVDAAGLQFYNFFFESLGLTSTNSGTITVDPRRWTDGQMIDCVVVSSAACIFCSGQAPTAGRNWLFRRPIWISGGARPAFFFNPVAAAATADADLNITIEHGLCIGDIQFNPGTGVGSNAGGGLHVKGMTGIGPGNSSAFLVMGTTGRHSTVTKSTIEGCIVFGGFTTIVSSVDTGCFVSKGSNLSIGCFTAPTTVPDGPGDVRNAPAHLVLPDLLKSGLVTDLNDIFGVWSDMDNILRFSGWDNTSPDFRGTTTRPWAGGATPGYLESGNFVQDRTSQLTGGGATSFAIYGRGERLFPFQLDPVSTTITVLTKSTAYVGTDWPSIILQENPALGITQVTATATDATEQTLTISITPTNTGAGVLRLRSGNGGKSGWTFFDVVQIT